MRDALDQLAGELADRYLVEDELGRGASATVYLARDLRHGRRVALKVLHSALGAALGVERFQREIRTQARLQHPHILPLFDSGVAAGHLYYTMPHVERGSLGDRLRETGPLDPPSVVQLATEVASALGYAHALGVIHRDLKPENIMFTAMGHAVLADFGIAWGLEDDADDDRLPSGARLTETGVTMGTPAYMSPEHAAGEAVDARSDQYSLAAVVYQALTGQPPFTGPNARAILAHKLTDRPPSIRASRPELAPGLEEVVLRGLARQPADRYDTVETFAAALARAQSAAPALPHGRLRRSRAVPVAIALVALGLGVALLSRRWYRVGGTDLPVSDDRVVAVLPFKNLGAAEDQYFADGLTEEITSRLASLSGLRVISRTSADQYRGSGKPLREIGAELGAGYLLEGSVRWERGATGPGRVRVTPQLIRVADDSHLWAESYDAELTEVFRIQSSIAQQVTTALDVALAAPEEALATVETRSAQAYDYYLRGNDYMARGYDLAPVSAAVDLYRKAVEFDSAFGPALARLGRAHLTMYWFRHDRSPARLEAARRAVDAAVRLAPALTEAQIALGFYRYWGRRDFTGALAQFEAARRQQPSNSEVLSALGYVERRRGRWQEAIAHFSESVRYDPRSHVRTLDLADTYLSVRQYPEAERLLDRTLQLAPDFASAYATKAALYLAWQGDRARSRAVVGQGLTRVGAGKLARAVFVFDAISGSALTGDSLFAPAVGGVTVEAFEGDTAGYHLFKAEAAHFQGDRAGEQRHADSAVRRLQRDTFVAEPDGKTLAWLGLAHARLGHRAEAIRQTRRAVELLPLSSDALSGPYAAVRLAQVYLLLGERARAVETLKPLLAVPNWVSLRELRADPVWAPLRNEPGLARLGERLP